MAKVVITLVLLAAFPCFDAKRVQVTSDQKIQDVEQDDEQGGQEAQQSHEVHEAGEVQEVYSEEIVGAGPKGGAKAVDCDKVFKALASMTVRATGCQKSGEFCCDSWMNEFGRELKAQVNTNPAFDNTKIRMMLHKWLIRPTVDGKANVGKNAHHAMMSYKYPGKIHWSQIGIDSHYFTTVNYCPGKYAVFDTITKQGRDVSVDFDDEGNLLGYTALKDNFKFTYSNVLKNPKKSDMIDCTFEECVATYCRSNWIDPKKLKATDAKSTTGKRCFLGIAF